MKRQSSASGCAISNIPSFTSTSCVRVLIITASQSCILIESCNLIGRLEEGGVGVGRDDSAIRTLYIAMQPFPFQKERHVGNSAFAFQPHWNSVQWLCLVSIPAPISIF